MTNNDRPVDRARRDAGAARARLMADVHQLQDRLRPTNLAEEAVENVKASGVRVADLARRKPVAATAAALGVILLIARKPIVGLFRRRRNDDKD